MNSASLTRKPAGRKADKAGLRGLGVRHGTAVMIAALAAGPQYGLRFVEDMGVSNSTVYKHLKLWEELKLIKVTEPPDDADDFGVRARWYRLTKKGREELVPRAEAWWARHPTDPGRRRRRARGSRPATAG